MSPVKLHNDTQNHYAWRQMVLQWHITERCNWRCLHCYQEHYSDDELDFENLLDIKEQFVTLLDLMNQIKSPLKVSGHINISGGEPFIRQDFMDLLGVFKEDKGKYSFGILTNGSFIDSTVAKRLKQVGPAFVQVSMEGGAITNDKIRGSGATTKTISAIKNLKQEGIPSVISFTAHRGNFLEFPAVAGLGRDLGVAQVWSDRLIPEGSGAGLSEQLLSPDETKRFFELMYAVRKESLKSFCRTEISMHRALQFLVGGGRPYRCAAGNYLVTVLPNGDVYPCRRMPIHVGNLQETPLVELYTSSEVFRALRNKDNISDECKDCIYWQKCRGGLRCLSYALTGNPFNADPGCWMKNSRPPRNGEKKRFPFDYHLA
ncbi:MAG: radical SAM protein [Deltaproteobacteria bacterium]|nr:radical SAM protein [Deltaproteobacteria bacterium]